MNEFSGLCKFFFESINGGTYISVKATDETKESIQNLISRLGIKNPIDIDEAHITLIYSTVGKPNSKVYPKNTYSCTPIKFSIFGKDEDTLVLEVECPELVERHQELIDQGLISDFDEYKPHVTLSYEYEGDGIDEDLLYDDKGQSIVTLEFTNETIESLK